MLTKLKKIFLHHYAIILYLIAYFLLFSNKLTDSPAPFFDWDESIYAQVAKEMMNSHSLVPLWQGQIWLDKPPFVPLFYGIIFTFTPFIEPEISGRLTTLILSVVLFGMLYQLYYKSIKETLLTTLAIVLTSVTPIFIQRSQVLNIDVFLLLGWVGYILFFSNFYISLSFLLLAVLSKTLVGFYPVAIVGIYQLFLLITKKINKKDFLSVVKKLSIQVSIAGIWYAIMFTFYGKDFWQQHIYETHFKRVSSSIESHFGQRTYYMDLLFEQFTGAGLFTANRSSTAYIFAFIMLVGLGLVLYKYLFKNKSKEHTLLYSTFILPWFLFLNVAKTKIFWYSYPYIPQFAYLLVFPITLLKKYKLIYYVVTIGVFATVIHFYFVKQKVHLQQFSKLEPHQIMAQEASKTCTQLNVLVSKTTRGSNKTLKDMGLTITTTEWWGEHPSMVYYFGKPIRFSYDREKFITTIKSSPNNSCVAITKEDSDLDLSKIGYTNIGAYQDSTLFLKK